MNTQEPVVLIAEDSEADVNLLRIAFRHAGFSRPLEIARDGEEAMAYLRGDGIYADRNRFPLPTVLLLDLTMLRKSGFDVLAWLQTQPPSLRRLPVYILSGSMRSEDIERAYDLGAHAYLVKPCNLDALTDMAKRLVEWLQINHFSP